MKTAVACAAIWTLAMLGGCSSAPPPGLASPSYSNDHTSAAGGFGLGPEQFNSNGGAFGPDQSDPGGNRR